MCFASDESGETYKYFLEAALDAIDRRAGRRKVFDYLMADCSEAVSFAFRSVSEQGTILNRRHCYFHVKISILREFKDHLGEIATNEEIRQRLKKYIHILHIAKTEHFHSLFRLFLSKFDNSHLRQYLEVNYLTDMVIGTLE